MEASQPAYRAGPLSELISHSVHMAKSIPPAGLELVLQHRWWDSFECPEVRSRDVFLFAGGLECSYGKILISPSGIPAVLE